MNNEEKYKVITLNLEKCFYCSYLICENLEELKNLELSNVSNIKEFKKIEKMLKKLLLEESKQYAFMNQKELKSYFISLYNKLIIDDLLEMFFQDELTKKAIERVKKNITRNPLIAIDNAKKDFDYASYCSVAQLKVFDSIMKKIFNLEAYLSHKYNHFFILELEKIINQINATVVKDKLIISKYSYLILFENSDYKNLLTSKEVINENNFKNKYQSEIDKIKKDFINISLEAIIKNFLYSNEEDFEGIDNSIEKLEDFAKLKTIIQMMSDEEKYDYYQTILNQSTDFLNKIGYEMLILAFQNSEENNLNDMNNSFKPILK